MKKLARRKNEKWAQKQIARQKNNFRDLLSLKKFDEATNNFIDIGTDAFLQRIDHYLDEKIVLPSYLDDGFVIPRK